MIVFLNYGLIPNECNIFLAIIREVAGQNCISKYSYVYSFQFFLTIKISKLILTKTAQNMLLGIVFASQTPVSQNPVPSFCYCEYE